MIVCYLCSNLQNKCRQLIETILATLQRCDCCKSRRYDDRQGNRIRNAGGE